MTSRMLTLGIAALVLAAMAQPLAAQDRWKEEIRAFEALDSEQAPPRHGIVFIGSSSIRLWDLEEHFGDLPVVNRGFGGSQIADSVRYADRILLPLEPKVVVLYAGDNDIASGKSAKQVATDFVAFVAKVHEKLPETRIVFIAIKPSIKRWDMAGEMRRANLFIRQMTALNPKLEYVDIDAPMLGKDGEPRAELFAGDGLHLNAEGYRLWESLVRPFLKLD